MVHGMRSLGSATLDLAYIAMGAFDIWWEGGCWEWDVAAGIAIVEEAGGPVTTANPPDDFRHALSSSSPRSWSILQSPPDVEDDEDDDNDDDDEQEDVDDVDAGETEAGATSNESDAWNLCDQSAL